MAAPVGNLLFLDDLVQGSEGPVMVMVSRKWDVNNINGRYMSSDFLVSDKKRTIMHCSAKNNIAHRFVNRMHEGNLYYLRGFTVLPNKSTYRILKESPYIIELQGSTVVTAANDDVTGFERHPFELVEFETLKPTENAYLADVVGYVSSLGDPTTKSNGRQTIDFNLTNERGRHVRVTLWGELGSELIERNRNHAVPHSIILTSMTAKNYLGALSLSSTSSTLVLDNNEIPALQAFNLALSNIERPLEISPVVQEQPAVPTLAALLQWARVKKHEIAAFKGEVEITKIRTKNGWFNLTCTSGKCSKGLSRRNNNFWCESCDTPVDFPRPRFRLQLDIKDDTAAIVVVFFDETAEKLTGTTAKALLAEENADDNMDAHVLPLLLENLVSKHVIEIKSHTYYQYGDFESFNCTRVVQPETDQHVLNAWPGSSSGSSTLMLGSPSKTINDSSSVVTPAKTSEPNKRKKLHINSRIEDSTGPHCDTLERTKSPAKNRRVEESDDDVEDLGSAEESTLDA